ncbi:hypothetical protein BVJ53_13080 [Lacticaseibacillus chiayiensis]|uniref:Uncharacterized protein n=1 Tax=Lacticaseibacillus chiayiensis TaxID=2100821 RepID=A0A4Q1TKW6_9LACO|nr:hypothetical protein BVJ53_13080 [Lacticaseibacillus chiayiensis]
MRYPIFALIIIVRFWWASIETTQLLGTAAWVNRQILVLFKFQKLHVVLSDTKYQSEFKRL